MAEMEPLAHVAPRRACEECNRKKTRCDMGRPICGLCRRTGADCSFPQKRRKPTVRRAHLKVPSGDIDDSTTKLIQALEAASNTSDSTRDEGGTSRKLLRSSLRDLLSHLSTSNNRMSQPVQQAQHEDEATTLPPGNVGLGGGSTEASGLGDERAVVPSGRGLLEKPDPATLTKSGSAEGIPGFLAVDLVKLFFAKVQPWLPILHQPRFQAKFEKQLLPGSNVLDSLSADESLLFCSMCALSARFSNHPRLAAMAPNKRGHGFAVRARHFYAQARSMTSQSLQFLQGCILLANYFYTSGPTDQGWILIGVCVRLAYDLGLSEIDDDEWQSPHPTGMVDREELRRAWWGVWELDTFASTVSRIPYSIDRKRMSVRLPVSDQIWFSGTTLSSAHLNMRPGQSWRSLQECENQDERAWFLVANQFFAGVHDRLQQRQDLTQDEVLTLENEICCFKLALPASLQLEADNMTYGETTFGRCNWIIGTHLMLMSTSFMVSGIRAAGIASTNGALSPLRQRAIDLSRIISFWDSRYIALSHPFLSCMMLPPFSVEAEMLKAQALIASAQDLGRLVLLHFSKLFKLGTVVAEIGRLVERGGALSVEEQQLTKRYSVFFHMPRLNGSSAAKTNDMVTNAEGASTQYLENSTRFSASSLSQQSPGSRPSFEPSMFDPQNYPQLPQDFYDPSNNAIDLGFLDFFGGHLPEKH